MALIDLTGKKFNYLQVRERAPRKANTPSTYWICQCDCGNQVSVESYRLRNGRTGSCGCKKGERIATKVTKHGHYAIGGESSGLRTWYAMLARCYDPANSNFNRYGATGVGVCERWREDPFAFLADMGPRPAGKTLDRFPDPHGNYEPSNCRWATPMEQSQNLRNNRHVEVGVETMTIRECATRFSLDYSALRRALYQRGAYVALGVHVRLVPRAIA